MLYTSLLSQHLIFTLTNGVGCIDAFTAYTFSGFVMALGLPLNFLFRMNWVVWRLEIHTKLRCHKTFLLVIRLNHKVQMFADAAHDGYWKRYSLTNGMRPTSLLYLFYSPCSALSRCGGFLYLTLNVNRILAA